VEVHVSVPVSSRFLLVDDEEEYIRTLSERLEMRGLASDVVLNGIDALAYLAEHEVEVVVLDLRMPGIDGVETLRRIKKSHPRVQVIIATGHGGESEKKATMQLGAFAYLSKPVDIETLAKTMLKASEAARTPGEEDRALE
jgi:DNA-binding NtrC family response regulator